MLLQAKWITRGKGVVVLSAVTLRIRTDGWCSKQFVNYSNSRFRKPEKATQVIDGNIRVKELSLPLSLNVNLNFPLRVFPFNGGLLQGRGRKSHLCSITVKKCSSKKELSLCPKSITSARTIRTTGSIFPSLKTLARISTCPKQRWGKTEMEAFGGRE